MNRLRWDPDTGYELRCEVCMAYWPLLDAESWRPTYSLRRCVGCYRKADAESKARYRNGRRKVPADVKRAYNLKYRRTHPERYELDRAYAKRRYQELTTEQLTDLLARHSVYKRRKALSFATSPDIEWRDA